MSNNTTKDIVTLPTLFCKKQHSSAVHYVEYYIEYENKNLYVVAEFGKVGGKPTIQKQHILDTKFVKSIKNLEQYKKNHKITNDYDLAVIDIKRRWEHKKNRQNYVENTDSLETDWANIVETNHNTLPMLACVYEEHTDKINWKDACVQPKLDGHRCVIYRQDNKIILKSRKGTILNIPHIQNYLSKFWKDTNLNNKLDGELYIHGASFEEIAKKIKAGDDASLKFYAFDYIVKDVAFNTRFKILSNNIIMKTNSPILLVDTYVVNSEEEVYAYRDDFINDGYEGAMLRHNIRSDKYLGHVRSSNLLKVKTFNDTDFEIVDYREGRGKYKGTCVFICKTPKGNTFEVAAPGTIKDKKLAWKNRKDYLNTYLTVKHQGYTKSKNAVPRFATPLRYVVSV